MFSSNRYSQDFILTYCCPSNTTSWRNFAQLFLWKWSWIHVKYMLYSLMWGNCTIWCHFMDKISWTSIGLMCFPSGFGHNRQKSLDTDTDAEADERTRTKSRSCDVGRSHRRGSMQPGPNDEPELRYRTLLRRLIQINQDQIKTSRKANKKTKQNQPTKTNKDLATSPDVRVVVETFFLLLDFGFIMINQNHN